jgi:subtilisin family serine protease
LSARPLSLVALALALSACGGGNGSNFDPSTPAAGVEAGNETGGEAGGEVGGGGGAGGTEGGTGTPPGREHVLVDPTTTADLRELCERYGARLLTELEGTAYCVVEIPEGYTVEEFLEAIAHEPAVELAGPDEGVQFPEGGGSTIPAFAEDDPVAILAQPALDFIGSRVANERGFRGEGVIVAVIDAGVDSSHPSLAGRCLRGWDFVDGDADPSDVGNGIDDDRDGRVDEGVGHGTFVASLVLAVAPGARIMPVRVLDSDSTGTASQVAMAIAWAVGHGAHVVNFSGGLRDDLHVIDQVMVYAKTREVGVIASAGNRGGEGVDYPAALSDVVGVTSVDYADRVSVFASFGAEINLSAPGEDLLGAHPRSPSGVARWSGTSFATALVTGGYALIWGAPSTRPRQIADALEASAASTDDSNPTLVGLLGAGRLDLDLATFGSSR